MRGQHKIFMGKGTFIERGAIDLNGANSDEYA